MVFLNKIIYRLKKIFRKAEPAVQANEGWSGNYASMEEAEQLCTGYDTALILNKCKEALLKVKNGEAVYERDSVIFEEIRYSWPLLAVLLRVAGENCGKLSLIDFGGSLGSSYYQNRSFIKDVCNSIRWNIVEQPNFVECGKEYFENEELKFYYSMKKAEQEQRSDLIILSSVLPYIKEPYSLLKEIESMGIKYILVDNTPFNTEKTDRLTIQKVPDYIYKASYPCWFLDEEKVIGTFSDTYTLESRHNCEFMISAEGKAFQYKGFLLKKK